MKALIVGKEFVQYKKKDGTEKAGISLHIQKDPPAIKANTFQGREVTTVWVSANTNLFEFARTVPVNSTVDFIYEFDGRYSNLVDIKKTVDKN